MSFRQVFFRLITTAFFAVVIGEVSGATEVGNGSDAEIARRFQERREAVLAASAGTLDPADLTKGDFLAVASALYRGEQREAALARLAKINEPMPTANMFWTYPMAALMMAGERGFDDATRARIAELWKIYWPNRGDTENHWAMYYASLYLAAQAYPGAGPEHWFNSKSSAEIMTEARDYLEHWMWVTTSYGQGEYDSPSYIQEYVIPMGLLAGWAQDPVFRQKARMMLDYVLYDYVVENVNGTYGGAHSRVYPKQIVAPGNTPIAAISWLLFGFGRQIADPANTVLALSGYTPPPILERIARDEAHRPYVERELKRTRWRMRNAGPHSFVIGDKRTIPVYKYSYVDRDFVLGSTQGGLLQPIQQQTWSLDWRTDDTRAEAANTFFAVQPYSSPFEGTMFFGGDWDTVTDLIARSKADYDSEDKLPSGSPHEQVFQHGTALIALHDLPAGNRFPHVTTFFSRDLVNVVEDASGWIFAQGGPVYIAYRPFAPGVWKTNDWTGLLARDVKGFIGAGFAKWGAGSRCYVSDSLRNGYVVQVAPVRSYASFAAFKAAILALPLKFSLAAAPEATFTTLDGSVLRARYGDTPTVNGAAVDYANWPLFDSPFAREARGSQRLDIRYGGERYFLDFTKPLIEQTAAAGAQP